MESQKHYPNLEEYRSFEHLQYFARKVVEGFITGLHRSPFHGFSVEFSEHRVYNPGESTRHIDWKLYGRTDRLYTKRYEEETNLRAHLVLDTSGSMFYPLSRRNNVQQPNKILFSTVASLALMNLFRKQRDAVGLSLFGDRQIHIRPGSTTQHHRLLAQELHKVLEGYDQPQAPSASLSEQLHQLAQQVPRRGVVMVFSDFYEALQQPEAFWDALQHLQHGQHEVILFWTSDEATELDFDFEDRPYRFVDMETGERLKLEPQQIRKAYREQMGAFQKTLREKCLQYGISLVQADVSRGYQAVLQEYLIQRRKVK
ncbi:MAG: DUF58 domain-containing protein [Schleiferiaceae bacterium]|nr:DUF58 domain-containing protein [Schleiferiaceae bacterium]